MMSLLVCGFGRKVPVNPGFHLISSTGVAQSLPECLWGRFTEQVLSGTEDSVESQDSQFRLEDRVLGSS